MALSAATRFFAIFELLEQVLLYIPACYPDISHNHSVNDGSPVVTPLFPFQGVNRTFAATIGASKKLRRRMLLEAPITASGASSTDIFRPLNWFIAKNCLSSNLVGPRIQPFGFQVRLGRQVRVQAYKKFKNIDSIKQRTHREDSWREIPLLDFDPGRTRTFVFLVEWGTTSCPYKVAWVLEYDVRPDYSGRFP